MEREETIQDAPFTVRTFKKQKVNQSDVISKSEEKLSDYNLALKLQDINILVNQVTDILKQSIEYSGMNKLLHLSKAEKMLVNIEEINNIKHWCDTNLCSMNLSVSQKNQIEETIQNINLNYFVMLQIVKHMKGDKSIYLGDYKLLISSPVEYARNLTSNKRTIEQIIATVNNTISDFELKLIIKSLEKRNGIIKSSIVALNQFIPCVLDEKNAIECMEYKEPIEEVTREEQLESSPRREQEEYISGSISVNNDNKNDKTIENSSLLLEHNNVAASNCGSVSVKETPTMTQSQDSQQNSNQFVTEQVKLDCYNSLLKQISEVFQEFTKLEQMISQEPINIEEIEQLFKNIRTEIDNVYQTNIKNLTIINKIKILKLRSELTTREDYINIKIAHIKNNLTQNNANTSSTNDVVEDSLEKTDNNQSQSRTADTQYTNEDTSDTEDTNANFLIELGRLQILYKFVTSSKDIYHNLMSTLQSLKNYINLLPQKHHKDKEYAKLLKDADTMLVQVKCRNNFIHSLFKYMSEDKIKKYKSFERYFVQQEKILRTILRYFQEYDFLDFHSVECLRYNLECYPFTDFCTKNTYLNRKNFKKAKDLEGVLSTSKHILIYKLLENQEKELTNMFQFQVLDKELMFIENDSKRYSINLDFISSPITVFESTTLSKQHSSFNSQIDILLQINQQFIRFKNLILNNLEHPEYFLIRSAITVSNGILISIKKQLNKMFESNCELSTELQRKIEPILISFDKKSEVMRVFLRHIQGIVRLNYSTVKCLLFNPDVYNYVRTFNVVRDNSIVCDKRINQLKIAENDHSKTNKNKLLKQILGIQEEIEMISNLNNLKFRKYDTTSDLQEKEYQSKVDHLINKKIKSNEDNMLTFRKIENWNFNLKDMSPEILRADKQIMSDILCINEQIKEIKCLLKDSIHRQGDCLSDITDEIHTLLQDTQGKLNELSSNNSAILCIVNKQNVQFITEYFQKQLYQIEELYKHVKGEKTLSCKDLECLIFDPVNYQSSDTATVCEQNENNLITKKSLIECFSEESQERKISKIIKNKIYLLEIELANVTSIAELDDVQLKIYCKEIKISVQNNQKLLQARELLKHIIMLQNSIINTPLEQFLSQTYSSEITRKIYVVENLLRNVQTSINLQNNIVNTLPFQQQDRIEEYRAHNFIVLSKLFVVLDSVQENKRLPYQFCEYLGLYNKELK